MRKTNPSAIANGHIVCPHMLVKQIERKTSEIKMEIKHARIFKQRQSSNQIYSTKSESSMSRCSTAVLKYGASCRTVLLSVLLSVLCSDHSLNQRSFHCKIVHFLAIFGRTVFVQLVHWRLWTLQWLTAIDAHARFFCCQANLFCIKSGRYINVLHLRAILYLLVTVSSSLQIPA